MYSDASELSIKNNRIELIEEGAFDASVRKFDFIGIAKIVLCGLLLRIFTQPLTEFQYIQLPFRVLAGNTVDFISHNGMSVACLHGKVVGNTFKNQTGSPLMDFGPGTTFRTYLTSPNLGTTF